LIARLVEHHLEEYSHSSAPVPAAVARTNPSGRIVTVPAINHLAR
jgi:hypothetical protein